MTESKCPKCGGSGKLPLYRKDGSIVPNAIVYCPDCHSEEPERYQHLTPDMYDFPCSSNFRAFSYRFCGVPDPCAVTVGKEVVREVVIERQPANMLPIRSELNYIRNQINEHIDAAKKAAEARKKPQVKQSYKGIK